MHSFADYVLLVRLFAENLIRVVCALSTVLEFIFIIFATVTQRREIYRAAELDGRLVDGHISDEHLLVIHRNWSIIGFGSVIPFGLIQWFWLRNLPWILLPSTIIFTILFVRLYLMKGMRYVAQRTERRDYSVMMDDSPKGTA